MKKDPWEISVQQKICLRKKTYKNAARTWVHMWRISIWHFVSSVCSSHYLSCKEKEHLDAEKCQFIVYIFNRFVFLSNPFFTYLFCLGLSSLKTVFSWVLLFSFVCCCWVDASLMYKSTLNWIGPEMQCWIGNGYIYVSYFFENPVFTRWVLHRIATRSIFELS